MTEAGKAGEFTSDIIKTLNLKIVEGTQILIGASNIAHMIKKHKYIFESFCNEIPNILNKPDYVRVKADDGSIEYIKQIDGYIKLAVRIAGDGEYYVRSIYRVHNHTVLRMIKNKTLQKVKCFK